MRQKIKHYLSNNERRHLTSLWAYEETYYEFEERLEKELGITFHMEWIDRQLKDYIFIYEDQLVEFKLKYS